MPDSTLWIVLAVGYFLTWLLIPVVLLRREIHASAAVAWIMSILFVPFLGAALFALIGGTRWEKRRSRKHRAAVAINEKVPRWNERHVVGEDRLGRWAAVAGLGRALTDARPTGGNSVEIIPDTGRSLDLMVDAIRAARRWVHVEFYIFRRDKAGTRLRDALIERARAGVEVRFLYDGIGSLWLNKSFLGPMREAGVRMSAFTPGVTLWHLLTLNLRNHRKIVVTDQGTAFTGGMNIGDEYLHPTDSFGEWRDTQLQIRGPATLQMQQVFAQDWYYATEEALTDAKFYPSPDSPGDVTAQVVADGPDNEVDSFYEVLVAALGQARERVTICTPYFVPPDGLAVALRTAARCGIRVRLMTAGRGNYAPTLHAGRSYYELLLRAGVEIFEYQQGLMHAKTVTVDGEWALVGTPNVDYRSLFLNFEVALSMFDAELALELERQFDEDTRHADRIELDAWRRRPTSAVLREQFWRLFSPIL